MNWISNILKNKTQHPKTNQSSNKIDYVKISINWNADPVSPEIQLIIEKSNLIMDIYLNHYAFANFKEGDKVKIQFLNCAVYSLNTCNDEGYYYGQYRSNPTELPWGEFYEIKGGLDKNFPEPIVKLKNSMENLKHFIFFFKDETFECLSSGFNLTFYNENE